MKFAFIFIVASMILGCRTLDSNAEKVRIVDKVEPECKKLALVYANWSWWGATVEVHNTLRNQVADLGGNTVVLMGDASGMAYYCKDIL